MDMLLVIALGVISRLMPHLPNMTAVGAVSLYAGTRMNIEKAAIIVFTTMFVSDMFLGFHSVMWATYAGMLFAVMAGRWVGKQQSILRLASATFFSSLVFFFVTNFAVWVVPGSMYPRTLSGLIACYVAALPFFRNSLLGDMIFTAILFGSVRFISSITRRLAIYRTTK